MIVSDYSCDRAQYVKAGMIRPISGLREHNGHRAGTKGLPAGHKGSVFLLHSSVHGCSSYGIIFT